MKLINATPHTINICTEGGTALATLPASGLVLRCATQELFVGHVGTIPVSRTVYGDVEVQGGGEVPAPQVGVIYIVSALVRLAAPKRADFLSPGPLLRDADGKPVGCVGLSAN